MIRLKHDNFRSSLKHVNDIVRDNTIITNNKIGFTETEIKSSDPTCKIIQVLTFFNISLNKNEKKLLSLVYQFKKEMLF